MVEYREQQLDAVFRALGDGTRRSMLGSLAQGERTVGQLAEPFRMSLAAASKHVRALEEAGLIRREIRGRQHICRLEAGPLGSASAWLAHYERFWTDRLDRLEALLGGLAPAPPPPLPTALPTPRPTPTNAAIAAPSPRARRRSPRPRRVRTPEGDA